MVKGVFVKKEKKLATTMAELTINDVPQTSEGCAIKK